MVTATDESTSLPPVLVCARITRQLHDLIAQGKGDSEEAEALADLGDKPWYAMADREQERMRGLSIDLYALREGGPKRVPMSQEELAKWHQALHGTEAALETGDVDAALAFLRQPIPESLPAYVIPFLQARCWEKLGDTETAQVFMNEAQRLDPGHVLRSEERRVGKECRSR